MTIEFKVTNTKIQRVDNNIIAENSQNYISAEFDFDEGWDNLSKKAVFEYDGEAYYQLLTNNMCTVPYEVLKFGEFSCGVIGVGESLVRATTNLVSVRVEEGPELEAQNAGTATQTLEEQIEATLSSLLSDAENGRFNGPAGEKGDPGEQGEPGEDGVSYMAFDTVAKIQEYCQTVYSRKSKFLWLGSDSVLSINNTILKRGYVYQIDAGAGRKIKNGVYTVEEEFTLNGTPGQNGEDGKDGLTTSVTVNGIEHTQVDGNIDLGTVITAHQDISGLQEKLIAGANISIASDGKTISVPDFYYIDSVGVKDDGHLYVTYTVPSTEETFEDDVGYVKGSKGDKGDTGIPGMGGYAPKVTITEISGGHRINITDENHMVGGQNFDVMDGENGADGLTTSVTVNGIEHTQVGGNIDLGTVITAHQDISGKENTANKVTSISYSSTDTQYPSAKCVYGLIGDIESALEGLL